MHCWLADFALQNVGSLGLTISRAVAKFVFVPRSRSLDRQIMVALLMRLRLARLMIEVVSIAVAVAIGSLRAGDNVGDRKALRDLQEIKHIIVIFQENWSFDALYGRFPGANGYANSFDTLRQLDLRPTHRIHL
jgi:Phosphoesterase family